MKKNVTNIELLIVLFLVVTNFFIASNASNEPIVFTEISTILTGFKTTDVNVNGNVLYALDSQYGLQIYNISDPKTPEKLGSYYDSYTFAHRLCFNNGLVFIADYEDKLEIVDVSKPTNPQIIGRYQERNSSIQWSSSTDLDVVDDLAFLASQEEGLEIIDISDLTQPVKIGSYYDGKSIIVVSAINDFAFIGESGGHGLGTSLKILNITDPTAPTEIFQDTQVDVGIELFISENLLYMPDEDFGLRIYNISDPSNAIKLGEKQIDGQCLNCVIETRGAYTYAFLAAWEAGLFVLDVTDPQNIIELAQYNDGGQSVSLFIQNDLVYVAERDYGLEILRIEGFEEETPTSSTSELIPSSSRTETAASTSYEVYFVILTLFLLLAIRKRKMGKN